MANITIQVQNIVPEITDACFNWCKNAQLVHQSNLQIQELGMIGIALLSLLAHHIIYTHSDAILRNYQISEKNLNKLFQSTYYFTFFMLILFLIFNIFFK